MGKRSKGRMAKKALAKEKANKKRIRDDSDSDVESSTVFCDDEASEPQPEHQIEAVHNEANHESLKTNKRKSKKAKRNEEASAEAALIRDKQNDIINSLPPSLSLNDLKMLPSVPTGLWTHTTTSPPPSPTPITPVPSTSAPPELKLARQQLNIRVTGAAPPPLTATNAFTLLPPTFSNHFSRKKNLTLPTPIQAQAWPALLSDVNVLGIAPTGSGKTLAYGLPLIHMVWTMLTESLARNAAISNKKKRKQKEMRALGITNYNQDLNEFNIVKYRANDGPLGLVLVPTRELASQVEREIKGAGRAVPSTDGSIKLKTMAIYGGGSQEDRKAQLDAFQEGEKPTHIIVCTPGRVLDLLASKVFTLKKCMMAVFDEGDRMLKLGFEEQVSAISRQVRGDARRCLLSATFGGGVREKGLEWVPEPRVVVRVGVTDFGEVEEGEEGEEEGEEELVTSTVTTTSTKGFSLLVGKSIKNNEDSKTSLARIPVHVAQVVHVCADHKKPKKLMGILQKLSESEASSGRTRNPGQTLVFFNQIKTLKYAADLLSKSSSDFKVVTLHGQMQQSDREKALKYFMAGKVTTMLATDVAARGIHVNRLTYVVNYDFPNSLEQYVHRCGRAGRGKIWATGTQGTTTPPSGGGGSGKKQIKACVYSFFTRNLKAMAPDVLTLLRQNDDWLDPNLVDLAEGSGLGGTEKSGKGKGKKKKGKEKEEIENAEGEDEDEDEDDEFASLGVAKPFLKRADVSSDSESASDSDS